MRLVVMLVHACVMNSSPAQTKERNKENKGIRTLCHLGLPAHSGLFAISTSVSHWGLAMAKKTQLAMMIARTRRLNQGFSTIRIASFLTGLVHAKTQKEKSRCCAWSQQSVCEDVSGLTSVE